MKSSFESKFPEIGFTNDEWNLAIDLYPCFYGAEWNTSPCDDNIILYLLAHLIITIQAQQSKTGDAVGGISGGRVQSKSVGNVSVSYAINALNADDELMYGSFLKTSYGTTYLTLIKNNGNFGGVFV